MIRYIFSFLKKKKKKIISNIADINHRRYEFLIFLSRIKYIHIYEGRLKTKRAIMLIRQLLYIYIIYYIIIFISYNLMFFIILCIYIFIDIFIYKTHSYDIPNVVSFSNATLIYSNMFFFLSLKCACMKL